jgi:aspartate/methionine/tyrosine aminotransferase
MSSEGRTYGSEYMQWAKLRSHARFNLATSGVPNLSGAELDLPPTLEITGGGPYGFEPLVEAIAARCGASPENVVTAAGTSMANHLALAALVEPGDEVLVEHPVYEPIVAAARYLGARVRYFERRAADDFRVDSDEVARLATPRTRAIVLTNLHNPTGAFEDEATLARVGEIAARVGARVVVDEVYLDAAFDDAPRSAFLLDSRFVVTNSLTKVYGVSGLRCGWIVADAATARRMWLLNDLFGVMPAFPAEQLSLVVFERLDELRARARTLIDTNRRTLFAFYDTREELVAPRFERGTTSFPRLAGGRVDALCDLLRERYETSIVPGRFFGLEEHFRIGLTCDPAMFEAGLERLGAALDELGE